MFTSELNALLDQQALQGQDPECRYIIDRVNWEQYEALLARNGDTSAYRVTYLDGALELCHLPATMKAEKLALEIF